MKYRPLFKSHGGKHYLWQWLVSYFPKNYEHLKYGEGCVGGGSVILNKNRSVQEIVNDFNFGIYNIYKFISEWPDWFMSELEKISYNESTFLKCKNIQESSDLSVETAMAELCVRRMSRGGLQKNFSWSKRLRGGQPGDLNAWETFKHHAHYISLRLQNVKVQNLHVSDFVQKYNQDDFFIYLDPPYLPSTRTVKKAYITEMTEKEHEELLDVLNEVKCKIMISGYRSVLYTDKLRDWNVAERLVANHSGQNSKKQLRTECIWYNY